jgi:hypothetical protein
VRGRTDGQSDITKLIVGFRNFANAPKSLLYSKDYYTKILEPSLIPTTFLYNIFQCGELLTILRENNLTI